ncbi:MAG: LTA synthase family protein, partial [Thermoanaerobaculia bacterium]
MGIDQDADIRTRSLVIAASGWALFVGAVVRLRIAHDVPLPPTHPFAWLFAGMLQDVAVFLLAGALALVCARRLPRTTRLLFFALAAAISMLHIFRSEAVVFFGDVIRPEDLRGDIPWTLAIGSLTGMPAFLFCLALLAGALVPALARRIRETDTSWLPLRRMVVFGAISAVAAAVLSAVVPRIGLARNPIVSIFAIQAEAMDSPHERFDVPKPAMSPTAIRQFAGPEPDRDYVDFEYPLAYRPRPANELVEMRSAIKPNIVFILMESVRAEEVGCYGADPPGVTPNLDALARDGVRVDGAFSAGTYTASGEVAAWYGLPPIPHEVLMTSRPSVEVTGLPEILRASGWRSLLWIHGGDSNFYRRDSFYVPRGFQIIDGRSFSTSEPSTNWGYSDRALVRNSITIFDKARAPFAAMMLTVSNHHPFELPADADPPMPLPTAGASRTLKRSGDMVQTVRYTDAAIGDFFRLARKRPWFKNTIFIITGDHGSAIPPYQRPISTNETLLQLMHRVPLIIYSPLLPGGMVIQGPASHIDLLPTILRLIHVSANTGLGTDLFDEQALSARVLPMWNAHQRVLTLATRRRIYHASYRAGGKLELETPIETLVDPVHDPLGVHNLAAIEAKTTEHFHDLANIYATIYPWLVVHGRSGLPPELRR